MNEKEDTSEKKKSTATIKAEAREKRLKEQLRQNMHVTRKTKG